MKLEEAKQILNDNGYILEDWNGQFDNYSEMLNYIKSKYDWFGGNRTKVFISSVTNDIAFESSDGRFYNIKYEPNTGIYKLYKPGNTFRFNVCKETENLDELLYYLRKKEWF